MAVSQENLGVRGMLTEKLKSFSSHLFKRDFKWFCRYSVLYTVHGVQMEIIGYGYARIFY